MKRKPPNLLTVGPLTISREDKSSPWHVRWETQFFKYDHPATAIEKMLIDEIVRLVGSRKEEK